MEMLNTEDGEGNAQQIVRDPVSQITTVQTKRATTKPLVKVGDSNDRAEGDSDGIMPVPLSLNKN